MSVSGKSQQKFSFVASMGLSSSVFVGGNMPDVAGDVVSMGACHGPAGTSNSDLKRMPFFNRNFFSNSLLYLIEEHLYLRHGVFFIARYRKGICTITHIKMVSPRFWRVKAYPFQLSNKFFPCTRFPLNHAERLFSGLTSLRLDLFS